MTYRKILHKKMKAEQHRISRADVSDDQITLESERNAKYM
jgi:hypothetical protein